MARCASVLDWDLALEHKGAIEEAAEAVSKANRRVIDAEDLAQTALLYVAEHPAPFRRALEQDGQEYALWGVRSELRRLCVAESKRQSQQVPLHEPDARWTAE